MLLLGKTTSGDKLEITPFYLSRLLGEKVIQDKGASKMFSSDAKEALPCPQLCWFLQRLLL
jgi:hypothetical protein